MASDIQQCSSMAEAARDLVDGTDSPKIHPAANSRWMARASQDVLDLAAATLRLIRIRTRGGDRSLARQAPATRALQVAAERIASSRLGAAHYRLARAQALTGDAAQAAASLALGREHGYLPIELMKTEPDFDPIRDDPRFQQILER